MHVPLLCTKAGVAIIALQGVLVEHTQFFCAGGAAVRSVVAGTNEGFPWARVCVFQHNTVNTTRDGMHLSTFVLTEFDCVNYSTKDCRGILICTRIVSADCWKKEEFFSVGFPTPSFRKSSLPISHPEKYPCCRLESTLVVYCIKCSGHS